MTGLKNSKKINVEKTLFLIGTTTAKTDPRPPVIPKPTIVGQVYRQVRCMDMRMTAQTGPRDVNATKNPDWMLVNCKKSCSSKIKDSNPSCPAWTKLGECTKNPNGLLSNCKLSCMRISARTE